MPKRVDLNKILVIGAGPIVIGQACEFDYSGTQACKALKDEGYFVILINSNPATIMTDENLAHRTYIEPITAEFVEKIIQKERPDAILPTVGGQTALNCALELWKNGVLDKYNVSLIGATPDAIDKAENRERFNQAMHSIGLEVAKNVVVNNLAQAIAALDFVGLPAIIRPSFTLGGSGGGIAYSKEEFIKIVSYGLSISPTHEVLIDESLLGWKEYEMEVVRDVNDNAIIICSIENIDPMGVHTGDSITVAPALTLTDKEYQYMRNASIAVLRVIGVETGGSNVQFAINPVDGRMVVIEMNPRVSRSSALASKATGFPIAKIAAKLAIGYTLDELKNDITRFTPAAFEPTLDYVVTKIPRFAFEKFGVSNNILTTSMKSVGEVMAIGRNFAESLQKALRSLDIGLTGLNSPKNDQLAAATSLEQKQTFLRQQLTLATPERLLYIAEALRCEMSVAEVSQLTNYTPWFVEQISQIVARENLIQAQPHLINERMILVSLKKMGFSDKRIAQLAKVDESYILEKRQHYKIHPLYKTIDTCAGEFASYTPYLYSCYEDDGITRGECESNVSQRDKVIILGGGPNRIGQGIEFDYACCHVAIEMKRLGIEAIMINCNPETVSTDYDTSDKLYFDPLYHEDVLEIVHNEQSRGNVLGVIVQFGGQTPLKLAHYLDKAGIKILGTSLDSIDLAEERGRFKEFLTKLNIRQPQNELCYSLDNVATVCERLTYPVVIRPSNVLGGRAMAVITSKATLHEYMREHKDHILDGAILIDKFLDNALEIDVDAICDGTEVYIAGIMEQIENAGVHSGDSACILPPHNVKPDVLAKIKQHTYDIALNLNVMGLLNIQYAVKNEQVYVLEVNPRASRTVPFVAKATGVPVIKLTTQVLLGAKLKELGLIQPEYNYYAVKEVIFPFARFETTDIILGPEMKSTGEVMGFDPDPDIAFAKAQIAVNNFTALKPDSKVLLLYNYASDVAVYGCNEDARLDKVITALVNAKCSCYIDSTVKDNLMQQYSTLQYINQEQISHMLNNGEFSLVIVSGDFVGWKLLRRLVILNRIPYCSTLKTALVYINANLKYIRSKIIDVTPLQLI